MKLIIATTSPPKVQAIKEAIARCPYFSGQDTKILTLKVPSDISDMPTSMTENMLGAKNRAENARNIEPNADF